MVLIVGAILLELAAAAALVWFGSRGRPADDHPVCRACGFDLFNAPPGQGACPECGADLRGRRAVRTGNRQRRRGPLYAGLALFGLTLVTAALVGTRVARGLDPYGLLPDAWVERDTRDPRAAKQRKAWAELTRRFLDNGLSSARTNRLTDAALARQADDRTTWLTEVGDFFEAAHKALALPRDKWVRYAGQAPRLSLRARDPVGRGDPIVVELREDGDRVAADSVLLVRLVDVAARGDLIVERGEPQAMGPQGAEQIGTGSFSQRIDVEEDRPAMKTAPAGKHAVEVAATLEVLEGPEGDPGNAKPLFTRRFDVAAEFELVGREATPIEVVPDDSPALRKQMEAAIRVDGAAVLAGSGFIALRHSAKAPPVPAAFGVTVRQGRREWKGTTTYAAGTNVSGIFFVPVKGFDGDHFDVIFEPDVDLARDTVDMKRLWNGRLEFRDVPIEGRPPRRRGTDAQSRHRLRHKRRQPRTPE